MTGGGSCGGACDPGDYLVWNLTSLESTEVVFVGFTETVDADDDGEADPYDEDDDNDEIPDWWETLHSLDPFDPTDAAQDPDEDGLTNLQEFLAGTDPHVHNTRIFADSFETGDLSAWSAEVP